MMRWLRRRVDAEETGERAGAAGHAECEAEQGGVGNVVDAVRAAGERHPVGDDQADDLAEGQGDDGEIVAAQAQHGKAEEDAPGGGQDAAERQAVPEAQAEILASSA